MFSHRGSPPLRKQWQRPPTAWKTFDLLKYICDIIDVVVRSVPLFISVVSSSDCC